MSGSLRFKTLTHFLVMLSQMPVVLRKSACKCFQCLLKLSEKEEVLGGLAFKYKGHNLVSALLEAGELERNV